MKTPRLASPVLLAMLLAGSTAAAQKAGRKPKPAPKAQPAPKAEPAPAAEPAPEVVEEPPPAPLVPTEDEGPIPEPKVPADPMALVPHDPEAQTPDARYDKRDYPVEVVKRPLTLAAYQAEISLEVPFIANDGHPTLSQVLRGAFGVTVDLQLGLTYSVGLERLDAAPGEDGFEAGKAFSVDSAYTIIPGYLAGELRLAFYADPDLFGMGIILGLPFKIAIGDRVAIFGGADLVRLKLKAFAVDPADPASNLAAIALRDKQAETPVGAARFIAGLAFQARPNVALYGTFGIDWTDFDSGDPAYALFAGATFSPVRSVDIGGRLGFYRLDDAVETFGVTVYAALRL